MALPRRRQLPRPRQGPLLLAALLLCAGLLPLAPTAAGGTDSGAHPRALPTLTDIAAAAGVDDPEAIGDPRNPPDPLTYPTWEAFVADIHLWGGVAIGDYDGDGRADLAVSRRGRPALYHNDGDLRFTDVGAAAGLRDSGIGMGMAWVDVDADGDLDLHVTNFGTPHELYRNNGNGTFTDTAAAMGIASTSHAAGQAWADYDRDGCLDLYVPNYLHQPNQLFHARCDGSGTFEDLSAASGTDDAGWGFQALWSDYDADDDPDLFVINDFGPDVLYRNDDNGSFTEVSAPVHLDQEVAGGMGGAIGDLDADADLDLFVTNYYEDGLYTNLGGGTFHESLAGHDLNDPLVGWGTNIFDLDNDGDLELYLANGFIFEYTHPKDQPNALFLNDGGVLRDVAPDLGVDDPSVTHGSAVGDLDADGDLDLYTVNLDGPSRLYRNDGASGHWLQLQLQGTVSNPQGIGTAVVVEAGGTVLRTELRAGGSYLSMDEPLVHLGLGESTSADRVTLYWPSGATQVLLEVPADTRRVVAEEAPLIARAGPDRTVQVGVATTLDGRASVSEADGTSLPYEGDFTWTLGAAGPGQVVRQGPTVVVVPAAAGRLPVLLEVRDSSGALDVDHLVLEVADTLPPVVSLGDDRTLTSGAELLLSGTTTTDDDPALRSFGTFAWTVVDPAGRVRTLSGFELALVLTVPGNHTITLQVTDPSGNVGEDTVQVSVIDATAPSLQVEQTWDIDEDVPLMLSAAATDADPGFDPRIAIVWALPPGEVPVTALGPSMTHTFADPGQYVVQVSATDPDGNVATAAVAVLVHDTTAPVVGSGQHWTSAEDRAAELALELLSDNDPLFASTGTVRWEVQLPSGTLTLFGRAVAVRLADPGSYPVAVTVSDRSGNVARTFGTLDVTDTTPPAAAAGQDQQGRLGEMAVLSARASTDNDPQLLRRGHVRWTITDPTGDDVSVDGWDVVVPLSEAGTYVATLEVEDPSGNIGTDTVRLTVDDQRTDPTPMLWRQAVLLALLLLGPAVVLWVAATSRRR